ncbi:Uncharacterised protein [Klebsiella quasipneumoniae]|nr:Uncharacterised protein [Klebsiella quasipneumoniae]
MFVAWTRMVMLFSVFVFVFVFVFVTQFCR